MGLGGRDVPHARKGGGRSSTQHPDSLTIGPCTMSFQMASPEGTARPEKRENPVIASTSSMDAAATTSEGMPLSTLHAAVGRGWPSDAGSNPGSRMNAWPSDTGPVAA